jgi:hypothetical protein
MRRHVYAAALISVAALTLGTPALADVEISDQPYVRHDGGTDVTIADCTSDATTPTPGGTAAASASKTSRPPPSRPMTRCT